MATDDSIISREIHHHAGPSLSRDMSFISREKDDSSLIMVAAETFHLRILKCAGMALESRVFHGWSLQCMTLPSGPVRGVP